MSNTASLWGHEKRKNFREMTFECSEKSGIGLLLPGDKQILLRIPENHELCRNLGLVKPEPLCTHFWLQTKYEALDLMTLSNGPWQVGWLEGGH